MNCPKCNSYSVKSGKYFINRTNLAQQRYLCRNCKYTFTERSPSLNKIIPYWKIQQILRLNKIQKGHFNKYDASRKTTYSTREIGKMLDLSYSYVANIIRNKNEKT